VKILILNQTFYPDVVATAHYAAHLGTALASEGHEVSAIAGIRAYDDPTKRFAAKEAWQAVNIRRIFTPGLGKASKLRRLVDFATFLLGCAWRLLWTPRHDVVVSLTSPPLIAFLAALFVRLKGGELLYWVMDLNPDQAIAAGMLQPLALRTRLLEWMLRYTLSASSRIIVLDRFMKERICARGIDPGLISTIPPWSHDAALALDQERRALFRREHGLEGKFVVMYAGNHSPCHPLDTLIGAAEQLAAHKDVMFCFVGGGVEHKKIAAYAQQTHASNVVCLPYPPKERLTDPLFAADLHVVVMGEPYLGIVHPCKVYNILALGTPLLYIGPLESHVTDLAAKAQQTEWFYPAVPGATTQVVDHILRAKQACRLSVPEEKAVGAAFSRSELLTQVVREVQNLVPGVPFAGSEKLRAATE